MNASSIGVSGARADSKSAAAAGDLAGKEEEKSFKAEEREIGAGSEGSVGGRRKRDSRLIMSDEFSRRLAGCRQRRYAYTSSGYERACVCMWGVGCVYHTRDVMYNVRACVCVCVRECGPAHIHSAAL